MSVILTVSPFIPGTPATPGTPFSPSVPGCPSNPNVPGSPWNIIKCIKMKYKNQMNQNINNELIV